MSLEQVHAAPAVTAEEGHKRASHALHIGVSLVKKHGSEVFVSKLSNGRAFFYFGALSSETPRHRGFLSPRGAEFRPLPQVMRGQPRLGELALRSAARNAAELKAA